MQPTLPDQPYRGIESFRYIDREIFSERDEEKEQLFNLIQIYRGVLLYGQSGIGKSSLIAAGLIPFLEERYQPEIIRLYPSDKSAFIVSKIVLDEAAGTYMPSIFDEYSAGNNPKIGLTITQFRTIIERETLKKPVEVRTASFKKQKDDYQNDILVDEEDDNKEKKKTPILIFDQFEELITLFEESGHFNTKDDLNSSRLEFQKTIIEVLRYCFYNGNLKLKMLFVFREDYLAKFSNLFDVIPDLSNYCLRIKAIPKDKLEYIIKSPFEKDAGHQKYKSPFSEEFVKQLDEKLKEYFGDDDVALTEVQIACLYLYGKPEQERKSLLGQNAAIKNILERFYLDILNRFNESEKPVAISILSLLVLNERTRNIFHHDAIIEEYLNQSEKEKKKTDQATKALCETVLNKLENEAKIIRKETRKGESYYEIRSEAIIPYINQQKILKEQQLAFKKRQRERSKFIAYAFILFIVAAAFAVYNIWKKNEENKAVNSIATLYKANQYNADDNFLSAFQIYERLSKKGSQYVKDQIADLKFENTYDISGKTIYTLKNNFILSSIDDSTYRLWKIDSKNRIKYFSDYTHVSGFAASKDSQFVSFISGDSLFLFDCDKQTSNILLKNANLNKAILKASQYSNYLTFYANNRLTIVDPDKLKTKSYKVDSLYSFYYENLFGNGKYLYGYYNAYLKKFQPKGDSLVFSGKTWDFLRTSWKYLSGDSLLKLENKKLEVLNMLSEQSRAVSKMPFDYFIELSDNDLILYNQSLSSYLYPYKNLTLYSTSQNSFINLQQNSKLTFWKQGKNNDHFFEGSDSAIYFLSQKNQRLLKIPGVKTTTFHVLTSPDDKTVYFVDSLRQDHSSVRQDQNSDHPIMSLVKYDVITAKKTIIDSIYTDPEAWEDEKYFKLSSGSNLIAYRKKINDSLYFIVKDLNSQLEVFRSSKPIYFPYNETGNFFSDDYIHVYNSNDKKEGIILLNDRKRTLQYFADIGLPKLSDEEWKKLLSSLNLKE